MDVSSRNSNGMNDWWCLDSPCAGCCHALPSRGALRVNLLCTQGYKTVLNTAAAAKLNLPAALRLTGLERRGRMFVNLPSKRRGCSVSSDKELVQAAGAGLRCISCLRCRRWAAWQALSSPRVSCLPEWEVSMKRQSAWGVFLSSVFDSCTCTLFLRVWVSVWLKAAWTVAVNFAHN